MSNINEVSFNGRRHRHRRGDQVGSSARALASLEIAIARGGTTFSWLQDIGIHRQAHAAPGLSPFKSRITKHAIKSLRFGLLFDESGPRDDHGMHGCRYLPTFGQAGCQP